MIRLQNVHKTFSGQAGTVQALTDINLAIQAGEIFGIIGQSGAGKSTLLRTINLLERPSGGEVFVGDQNLMQLSPLQLRQARHKISMIFQHFNLLSALNVEKNIGLSLKLRGEKPCATKISELLELTHLSGKEKSYPYQLSGGEKQRVAIARALLSEPDVLLCDEATSALDPETTFSILSLLKQINETLGLTIVLITHEMPVIKAICDRVAVINKGRIVEVGEVLSVLTHPRTLEAKKLLGLASNHQLPADIKARLQPEPGVNATPILRLSFMGARANEPVVAELITRFGVLPNILQAAIEWIQDQRVGIMILALTGGDREILKHVMTFLDRYQIVTEVLGYINTHETPVNLP